MSKGADDDLNHDINDDRVTGIDDSASGGNRKMFKFDIVNGQVVAVFEFEDGKLEQKSIDDDGTETYTLDGDAVIRTEIKLFGTEITRYEDSDGDGIFFRTSEVFQGSDDSPFKFHETLRYSPTANDDFIAVRSGEHCQGGQGADDFVFREAGHLLIGDFHHGEGDRLVFDTGLGLTSNDHLASFITDARFQDDNFIVSFGDNVSITLIGIHDGQIGWDDVSVLS
ncbi:hypothetical protein [Nitrosomonas sp.]|uniref:hypothetical protein n=1 Tax=Nitrosomonas sp. TaxID=42353 RepID=UPI00262F6EFE|nr:hypothetical protein [Nitrosomonas sp.]